MNQTAKCLSGYEWSFSSIKQSPCEVAAALAGICVGSQFGLAPLDPGVVYLGPSQDSENSCRCSSVYYALLSACAYCQMRGYIRWSAYTVNCSTAYLQRFVEPIPRGIDVPLWAYQDVSIDDTFNVTLAQTNATNSHSSSSTSTQPGSTSTTDGNSINVAAIAGGLVGGFLVIGFVVGFVAFYLTRRHSRSSRNDKRIEETQTQDFPMIPGFSSSVNPNPISASQVSLPLFQSNFMTNTLPLPQVSPPRHVPFRVNTNLQSQSASLSEYLMTKATPYTVPSPSSPNVPSSQDSKQALLSGTSNNFSDALMPETFNRGSAFQPSSSSLSYQQHHQFPPQQGSSMSPLMSSEQLPPYSEIMGSVSPTPRVPVPEKGG